MRVRVRTRVRIHTRKREIHRQTGQMFTVEDRVELSDFVDKRFWGGRRDKKDIIEKFAETAYGPCLKKLWQGGEVTRENYQACAREADIYTGYKRLWGKA